MSKQKRWTGEIEPFTPEERKNLKKLLSTPIKFGGGKGKYPAVVSNKESDIFTRFTTPQTKTSNIEPHVTSLQLSKQLHDAGFVRESVFSWVEYDNKSCTCNVKGCECGKGKYHTNRYVELLDDDNAEAYQEQDHIEVVGTYPAYLETELNTELRKVVVNTLLDNATDKLRELVRKVESLWNNPNLLEDKGKLILYLIQHQLIEV